MSRGDLNKHLYRIKVVYPTIICTLINKGIQLHWYYLMNEDDCVLVSSVDNNMNYDNSR